MARYIKANPLVAKHLNLQNDRNTVKDGNYILWQADMLAFGPLIRLPETLAAIGAIALMPHEAREEQDGIQLRPLPEATDPRFIMPAASVEETEEAPDGPVEDEETEEAPDSTEQEGGNEAAETENPSEEENPDNITPNDTTV